ncbi:hypothetical protein G7046_g9237 [Stylonectria norvegica]|nr:hypothetical protein G7046_g9237 [Stylonectria norvegica]
MNDHDPGPPTSNNAATPSRSSVLVIVHDDDIAVCSVDRNETANKRFASSTALDIPCQPVQQLRIREAIVFAKPSRGDFKALGHFPTLPPALDTLKRARSTGEMDIDDILRGVDPISRGVPAETRDLQALTRLWVAERSAPELLEWPADGLFERVNARIKAQIEKVEDMTGDMDPKTNFALIVIQTELERYKFLVRSYLRARIAKIDKHTLHYLSNQALRSRLSPTEAAYATRHQALLHNHYLSSFLGSFPEQLQNLNDTAGNISMIDSPDLDTAVFIRMLRDKDVHGKGTDKDNTLPSDSGDIVILRWSSARPLVEDGDAELLSHLHNLDLGRGIANAQPLEVDVPKRAREISLNGSQSASGAQRNGSSTAEVSLASARDALVQIRKPRIRFHAPAMPIHYVGVR